MSTLEQIRQRPILIISILGLALLLFILTTVDRPGELFTDSHTVAKIDGEKIDYMEFQKRVEQQQEQLQQRLQESGILCTQATISRDIKQLHLIKEPVGQGRYRYAVSSQRSRLNMADKLRTIFRESIISVDFAQNIVVIKTMAGLANAAAAALDGMDVPDMVGTLAGDDTALLVMKDLEAARGFCEDIHEMLK